MTTQNKNVTIIMVGGFFAIIGIVAFLLALHYAFTGVNLACR